MNQRFWTYSWMNGLRPTQRRSLTATVWLNNETALSETRLEHGD